MATFYRKCKICGRNYPYCTNVAKSDVFRWQDVTCCFEHGAEYLARMYREQDTSPFPESTESNTPSESESLNGNDIVVSQDNDGIETKVVFGLFEEDEDFVDYCGDDDEDDEYEEDDDEDIDIITD